MSEKTVLAIDPGRNKCGFAVVRRTEEHKIELVWSDVVPTTHVVPKIHEAYAACPFQLIVIGGGTNSGPIIQEIREQLPSMAILEVDERNTTLQARERYWEHFPRRGIKRLFPATLFEPPRPVDDFVALILAERVLIDA
jgi:RNase H-fold protein (predicted Holliday junction resolvase)